MLQGACTAKVYVTVCPGAMTWFSHSALLAPPEGMLCSPADGVALFMSTPAGAVNLIDPIDCGDALFVTAAVTVVMPPA
jgi:hypothetical protein